MKASKPIGEREREGRRARGKSNGKLEHNLPEGGALMEGSNNDNQRETITSPGKNSESVEPGRRTRPIPGGKGVFILRAKGQSIEEFKKVCIQRFREAGLLAGGQRPQRPSPGPAAGSAEDDKT